jgi:hypothetical protein
VTEQLPDDAPVCPHPMREGENTSSPDAPGRCLLCGTPWDQVEAQRADVPD